MIGDIIRGGTCIASRRAAITRLAVRDTHTPIELSGIEHRRGRGGGDQKSGSDHGARKHGGLGVETVEYYGELKELDIPQYPLGPVLYMRGAAISKHE